MTPHTTSAAALTLQRKWPHTSIRPPRAIAFSSRPQFPFPSGFTSRPPCKRQTRECHLEPCPHPFTPTHAADVWVSLNHDRKHWRHRGGRRGGPLPGAVRRSRILGLFLLPCSGGGGVGGALQTCWGRVMGPQVQGDRACTGCLPLSEPPLLSRSAESSPSDPSMSTPNSYPALSEVFGRKRKKRTSIETNIRLTLEKRFQDVSRSLWWGRVG